MGPGVIGPAEMKALMFPSFLVIGHNSCKTKAPLKGAYVVELAFYDKEEFRTAVATFYVASLESGEKFKHAYEVPGDARILGPVVSIRVRSIMESPVIPPGEAKP